MDPESEIACFIDRKIRRSWKVPAQIVDQHLGVRRLCRVLMIRLAKIDAYFSAFLQNVDSDIDMLTGKLDFCTFRTHGKPPFGCGTLLADTTIYSLKSRTLLLKHPVF